MCAGIAARRQSGRPKGRPLHRRLAGASDAAQGGNLGGVPIRLRLNWGLQPGWKCGSATSIRHFITKILRRFLWRSVPGALYNYASLWVAMSVCIPTYMLASGLIAGGMDWWQAVGTILLGNLIVLVPMLLNAHAGTKYGIPFPVFVRASFGVRGANVPAVLRALVACGWFGIQTWIGGQAIYLDAARFCGRGRARSGCALDVFLFWLLNMMVIWRGIETIKFLEGIGAPFMLVRGIVAVVVDHGQGGRIGAGAAARRASSSRRGSSPVFHSVADGDGGFLGHRRAEHSGLHALCEVAEGADAGAGAGVADGDDALLVYRRGGDVGVGGDFWASRSGIRWC